MNLLASISLALLFGCAPATAQQNLEVPSPSGPPVLRLYTAEGYATNWWIWEEDDGSCTIEYDILNPQKAVVAHSKVPCQLFFYFFHAIQPRKSA